MFQHWKFQAFGRSKPLKVCKLIEDNFQREKIFLRSNYIIFTSIQKAADFSRVATFPLCQLSPAAHRRRLCTFVYSPFCKWFAWKACWNIACMMALEFSFVSFEKLSWCRWKSGTFIDERKSDVVSFRLAALEAVAASGLRRSFWVDCGRAERRDSCERATEWRVRRSIYNLFILDGVGQEKGTLLKATCWCIGAFLMN